MRKIGFILNPLAGVGGKVGLKGSDGRETVERALRLGAKRESHVKAKRALDILRRRKDDFVLLCYPAEMGEDLAKECGLQTVVLGEIEPGRTTAQDTVRAARQMRAAGAELLLFVGGDGTARNILDAVGTDIPVVGLPAGCKIYSAAYALNPEKAGELIVDYLDGKVERYIEAEVLDIDEEAFRRNVADFRLYGCLRVPQEKQYMQNLKVVRIADEDVTVRGLSKYLASRMEANTLYIVGSGSTTAVFMKELGLANTLLGVDVVYNGEVLENDVCEEALLGYLDRYDRVKLFVTVIGGQGYLFGRGNQQLSARVLERVGKENILVMAARDKMEALESHRLYVDTGDARVNGKLHGPYKILVGANDFMVFTATS